MIAFLMSLLILSPSFKTVHQFELKKYKDYIPPSNPRVEKVTPLIKVPKILTKTVYGFFPYWRSSQYQSLYWDLISHIAFFGIELGGEGQITNDHGWPDNWSDLVSMAHEHGVQVHLVAILFGSDNIHSVLTHSDYTQNFISNVLDKAVEGNADGVNLDIEIPYSYDRDLLTSFVTLVAETLHAHGLEVTIDLLAIDDVWSDRYDQDSLAKVTDGLMIMDYDFYWAGASTSGPVAPLTGGTYNVSWSIDHYLETTGFNRDKIIMGVPYYGYDWPTQDSLPYSPTTGTGQAVYYYNAQYNASVYGRLWDTTSQTPWYRYMSGGGWRQCWYDDDTSLGLKYDFALSRDIQGIGIWALTYDGDRMELWETIMSHFATPELPARVEGFSIQNYGLGRLSMKWYPSHLATRYRIMMSQNSGPFVEIAEVTGTSYMSDFLPLHAFFAFKVVPANPFGDGECSDVLPVRTTGGLAPALIVYGFERNLPENTRDFAVIHGRALSDYSVPFDATTDRRVEDGTIDLNWYHFVDWIVGEEDTGSVTLSHIEEEKLMNFLENGGRLLITGSNIGEDLYLYGDSADKAFYNNYLMAEFLDTSGLPPLTGEGILSGIDNINLDDGSHGTYPVSSPDVVYPLGSSSISHYSDDTLRKGGVYYSGVFGAGTEEGALVYLSFPVEAVWPDDVRDSIFVRVFDYFDLHTFVAEGRNATEQAVTVRPNIGREIRFAIKNEDGFNLSIYDVTGRLVRNLYVETGSIVLRNLKSGVYFYEIKWRGKKRKGKFLIVR